MNLEDLKVGDVVEYRFHHSGKPLLAEIIIIDSGGGLFPILALVPRNCGHGHVCGSLREGAAFYSFKYDSNLSLDTIKLLQHKICPLKITEIVNKTNQRW